MTTPPITSSEVQQQSTVSLSIPEKKIILTSKQWYIFWICSIGGIILIGTWIRLEPTILQLNLKIIAILLMSLAGISFLISVKSIPGGYSILKQAICHIGRMYTKKGKRNLTAAILFNLSTLSVSSVMCLSGLAIEHFAHKYNHLNGMNYILYFSAMAYICVGLIPIDVNERRHLYSALCFFSTANFVAIYTFVFLAINHKQDLIMTIAFCSLIISGFFYTLGYIRNSRYAGGVQKLWIASITWISYLYLLFFWPIVR